MGWTRLEYESQAEGWDQVESQFDGEDQKKESPVNGHDQYYESHVDGQDQE